MKTTTMLILLASILALAYSQQIFCWKDSYGRGVGTPLDACPSGTVQDGALCYPPCDTGYTGVGPVCWAQCPSGFTDTGTQCQKKSYGRGAGTPVHACKSGYVKDGALCYPSCSSGYYGVGPVCWSSCPSGWTDTGALCQLWADTYGKGCCCTVFGCCHNCRSGYTDYGCTCTRNAQTKAKSSYGRGAGIPLGCADNEDLDGALCYPKCQNGYTGVGPVCWANCVGNTVDTGVACTKKSYGRTAGVPMVCKSTEDEDAGLCYTKCNTGYTGVGPVCWSGCPSGWTNCGAACGVNQNACANKIIDMATTTTQMVVDLASFVTGVGAAAKIGSASKKLAEELKMSSSLVKDINEFAKLIQNQTLGTENQTTSKKDAKTMAKQALAQVYAWKNDGAGATDWDLAYSILKQVDPTGILNTIDAFNYSTCSHVKPPGLL